MEKKKDCRFRKRVDGMDMCYAIGCCEVGDMPCPRPCGMEGCPYSKEGKAVEHGD